MVTVEAIKELRQRTGVGMGKCKEALVASSGDMDKAITYLREKGVAGAVKKEGRTTNEGLIGTARGQAGDGTRTSTQDYFDAVKRSDAELTQYRSPVGFGPSGNT